MTLPILRQINVRFREAEELEINNEEENTNRKRVTQPRMTAPLQMYTEKITKRRVTRNTPNAHFCENCFSVFFSYYFRGIFSGGAFRPTDTTLLGPW